MDTDLKCRLVISCDPGLAILCFQDSGGGRCQAICEGQVSKSRYKFFLEEFFNFLCSSLIESTDRYITLSLSLS